MALLHSVKCDAGRALVGTTKRAKAHAWTRWGEFCAGLELSEDLQGYDHEDRGRMAAAFVAHSRRRRFRGESGKSIKEGHLRKIVSNVGETLVLRGGGGASANPFKGPDGEFTVTIKLLLRTYKIEDPPTKRQQPLSPSGLRHIIKSAVGSRGKFVANLLAGAFFFACRSCEYVNAGDAQNQGPPGIRHTFLSNQERRSETGRGRRNTNGRRAN